MKANLFLFFSTSNSKFTFSNFLIKIKLKRAIKSNKVPAKVIPFSQRVNSEEKIIKEVCRNKTNTTSPQ